MIYYRTQLVGHKGLILGLTRTHTDTQTLRDTDTDRHTKIQTQMICRFYRGVRFNRDKQRFRILIYLLWKLTYTIVCRVQCFITAKQCYRDLAQQNQ